MSWKENRRRDRTWYLHYRRLCDQLTALCQSGSPIAGEAIIKMFFELYEERRLHRNQRLANSAYESLVLACKDSGLTTRLLFAGTYATEDTRPPAAGEFGAVSRTGTRVRVGESEYVGAMPKRIDVPVYDKDVPF